MKFKMAFIGVAAFIATSSTGFATMQMEVGPGEGALDIVAWPGYIERGETMKEFDWVTSFEEATGLRSACENSEHFG